MKTQITTEQARARRKMFGAVSGPFYTLSCNSKFAGAAAERGEGDDVDTPADALRDGLLASGATLDGMLADLRERREADGEADRCRLKIVINNTAMSAAFTSRADAMLAAIDWVQDEAETRFSGNLDERYAAAYRWVEGQGGTMEITE